MTDGMTKKCSKCKAEFDTSEEPADATSPAGGVIPAKGESDEQATEEKI